MLSTLNVSWIGRPQGSRESVYVLLRDYKTRVLADGGILEAQKCLEKIISGEANPIITLIGNARVDAPGGEPYVDQGATAYDAVLYGDLSERIVTVNNVDVDVPGTYTITYNATDRFGNAAEEVEREVYVTSLLAPYYRDRVIADGGIVESLGCVDKGIDVTLDWSYYARVSSDGGIVEALECATL